MVCILWTIWRVVLPMESDAGTKDWCCCTDEDNEDSGDLPAFVPLVFGEPYKAVEKV